MLQDFASQLAVIDLCVIGRLRPQESRILFVVELCLGQKSPFRPTFKSRMLPFTLQIIHNVNELLIEEPSANLHYSLVETYRVSAPEVGLVV